jgi:ANTAR domain-containing protein
VAKAVETVPSADAGGITLTQDAQVDSRYHTADPIGELDELQNRLNEGPCVTAAEDPPISGVILADDLAGEDADRWPQYAKAAVEAGYRSMCSTQLSSGSQGLRAALNLYSTVPRAFDSRDVIGQAEGILMERFGVDGSEAFQMLVRSSQETNLKLVKVAAWIRDDLDQRRRDRQGGDGG